MNSRWYANNYKIITNTNKKEKYEYLCSEERGWMIIILIELNKPGKRERGGEIEYKNKKKGKSFKMLKIGWNREVGGKSDLNRLNVENWSMIRKSSENVLIIWWKFNSICKCNLIENSLWKFTKFKWMANRRKVINFLEKSQL